MMNDAEEPVFASPATFMGVPFSDDATGSRAAILGCPFDCGTHPFRVGARQGPTSIRQQSGLVRRYQPELADVDILDELRVVDCGDVKLTPSRMNESFDAIEAAALRVIEAGAVPIGLGGDGSVSLPLMRAASRVHPGLAVIHIDSHTDAYPIDETHPYDAATQFSHAAIEQRVRVSASYHLGLRGTTTRAGVYEHGRDYGYNLITLDAYLDRGADDVVGEIRERTAGLPIYLSWDMDVFDPSCAPGVCTPVWGGLSAREGMALIRQFTGMNVVAADINTVSPPQDRGGMTGFLAAAMVYEILLLIYGRDVSQHTNGQK